MRKKIYLCLAAETMLIIAATIAFLALKDGYDGVTTCIAYICTIALINAFSTAYINAAMFEDALIDVDDLDDLNDDDDDDDDDDSTINKWFADVDDDDDDDDDDGIIRGADGKL